jgi:AcrR family transcriptional regulator
MPRRTGEQTKDLLIRTGLAMLLDRGISAGVSHIRLQEVVRRAGLTTGAAYRLWPDQDAFHHDLAVAAARWRSDLPVAGTWARIGELVARRAPLMEVVRQGAQAHVDTFDDDERSRQRSARSFLVALALRATSATWIDLRDASVARHGESVREFAALYSTLMAAYGLRPRDPFTVESFTVAMAALGEGFALQCPATTALW